MTEHKTRIREMTKTRKRQDWTCESTETRKRENVQSRKAAFCRKQKKETIKDARRWKKDGKKTKTRKSENGQLSIAKSLHWMPMKKDDQAALRKLTFVTSSFFSGGSSPSSTYIQHLHVMSCKRLWKQSTHVVPWLKKCEQAYTRTTPAVTLG